VLAVQGILSSFFAARYNQQPYAAQESPSFFSSLGREELLSNGNRSSRNGLSPNDSFMK
jgi:hypothetical protein